MRHRSLQHSCVDRLDLTRPVVGRKSRRWRAESRHHLCVPRERRELAEATDRDDPTGGPLATLLTSLEENPRTVAEAQDGSAEAEALVLRARQGDLVAREKVIDRFLPLVKAMARRYSTDGLEETDLLQEGIVGLLQALVRFEPERGVPFSAYATLWIRQALQNARSDFIRPFRLPPKALRQLSQLKTEHQRVYQAERRSPSVEELAERTDLELGQARALVAADARLRSLDEAIETGGGATGSLGDILEDPLSGDVYEQVIDAVAGEQLRALLTRLTDREREVIRARFGFDRDSEKLVEIADRLGISAERVRQIEERGLTKLRESAS